MGKVHDLTPRLLAHYDNQIDYYERQKRESERLLADLAMRSSGQLVLFDNDNLGDNNG